MGPRSGSEESAARLQNERPEEALTLARGMRLSRDTPPSWRAWLLDVARAHTDMGNAAEAVRALERLRRVAPGWCRQHSAAVTLVRDLGDAPSPPPGPGRLAGSLGLTA
ncbi:hypothetical protein Sdia_10760 [Streptomyces diastaticus subsp. diastaticus]|uniref:Tetratricopeptide repeat protein n=1 Tax=Streptomyces diastaticus subsp. diastaticus TaxID=68040 RepID=A0ABQ1CJR0_STRDI|nr:hypothetical protein Sdia_10760 [Streptomyces diastaticus subsp. diastaticus]GGU16546.1 hypothetical protein GCM10015534_19210 [Streptomyces diastaticus subsp. diastaticus]